MNKIYHLTIDNSPLTLTLTPPPQWGYCFLCKEEKGIRIISQNEFNLQRKFCQTCALNKLEELWEYDFKNQEQIIKDLRKSLLVPFEGEKGGVHSEFYTKY